MFIKWDDLSKKKARLNILNIFNMSHRFKVFIGLVLILQVFAMNFKNRTLTENWKMKVVTCPGPFHSLSGYQQNVSIPSTLHLNLQKSHQIPIPYFSDNLNALNQLSQCEVKFSTNLKIEKELTEYSKISLIFQGIDTYSEITLNKKLLGKTINAFLKYQYSIKDLLLAGNNYLQVSIKPTKPHDNAGQQKDRMPFDYAHTRKACYQYSWDWAPYMNTMGIWLPVEVQFYDETKIDYTWLRIENINPEQADLDIVIALDGLNSDESLAQRGITAKIVRVDNQEQKQFILKAKYSNVKWVIPNPQLWWPNNIGTPHVYQFDIYLLKNKQILSQKHVVYGLRTVNLNQQGTNFQIILNGYPVYCKGANYVPPDMMYPRLINPDFKSPYSTDQLLSDAVASNFNMMRLWGGGQYQTDSFYQTASKKGIMIFHDFMFSDSIYPGTDEFIENVKEEIIYQVRRLRNHPSVVLWSGNNQILQGIQSWGWGQPKYRENYDKLFGKIIPDILRVESNHLPYIQSSPSRGVGNAGFQQGGDIHYWGVWAAGSPFQSYQSALGGFNSEFGTQSLPVWQTILQFTFPDDRNYQSPKMLFHQKHNSRFTTLRAYMNRYAHKSLTFELQSYSSGLVHAFAMEIAIRAQRISKPKSMGTLYWMLNDAWPAISWSSIDYYGRWKAVQYFVKNLYKDVILFYHPLHNNFVAVNDKLYGVKANYIIQVATFDGSILFEDRGPLALNINERRQLKPLEVKYVSGKESRIYVYTEIIYGDKPENRTTLVTFLKPYKDLQLEPSELTVHFLYGTNEIIVSTNYLIKNLYISSTLRYLKLTENYVDVLPGRKKTIGLIGNVEDLQTLKPTLVFRSYRETYDPSPLKVNFEN